ncbi:MAG: flagellar biosynthetic protein FliO [Polyangiaceae bacterium]|nr:flagellar biosynthetic protein FliO [Polyangiaceae bacterium]
MKAWMLIAALTVAVLPSPAFAQAADAPDASDAPRAWLSQRGQPPLGNDRAGGSPSGARALLGLVAMAALAGGVMFWRKKRDRAVKTEQAGLMLEVLASTRLGPKAQAVVARVGKKVVLLGVTEHSVQKLAWLDGRKLTAPAAALPEPAAPVEPRPQAPGFAQVIRDVLGRTPPARPADAAVVLAEETRDVYVPSAERRPARIETQAAGLVARLRELER